MLHGFMEKWGIYWEYGIKSFSSPQVKLLNKLAAARTLDSSIGSKVLTDLVEGLEEAAVTVEIRLKIDQNHADLKGGYVNSQMPCGPFSLRHYLCVSIMRLNRNICDVYERSISSDNMIWSC